jgi:VWFA-related protein
MFLHGENLVSHPALALRRIDMKYLITALISIFLFSLFATTAYGQDEEKAVRVGTELVSVSVAVVDGEGKPVTGLSQRQFEIFDEQKKQKIEEFSAASAGVTFGIVYDMHPTTTDRTNAVLNGLREFTKGLPATNDFFFVVFNERGSLSLDFVPDADQLARHLASPQKREPRSLYDALYLAARQLRQRKNLKKTLLVVTDAADHNSRKSFNDLRDELKNFDVQIYAIVLDETLNRFNSYVDITKQPDRSQLLSDASPKDRAALSSIALRTGGATFPSSLEDQRNILRISQQIATDMQNQYTLSFYPSDSGDGKWHRLRVGLRDVPGSKKFVLTYRQGYQSDAEPKQ